MAASWQQKTTVEIRAFYAGITDPEWAHTLTLAEAKELRDALLSAVQTAEMKIAELGRGVLVA